MNEHDVIVQALNRLEEWPDGWGRSSWQWSNGGPKCALGHIEAYAPDRHLTRRTKRAVRKHVPRSLVMIRIFGFPIFVWYMRCIWYWNDHKATGVEEVIELFRRSEEATREEFAVVMAREEELATSGD